MNQRCLSPLVATQLLSPPCDHPAANLPPCRSAACGPPTLCSPLCATPSLGRCPATSTWPSTRCSRGECKTLNPAQASDRSCLARACDHMTHTGRRRVETPPSALWGLRLSPQGRELLSRATWLVEGNECISNGQAGSNQRGRLEPGRNCFGSWACWTVPTLGDQSDPSPCRPFSQLID